MTAKFDEMSLGSLMTSRLAVNAELLIQLDSQMPQLVMMDEMKFSEEHLEEYGLKD